MTAILSCLCYPFHCCCPCLYSNSQTTRTQQTKNTRKSEKTMPTLKSDKTVESPKKVMSEVKIEDKSDENKKPREVVETSDPTEESSARKRKKRHQWEKEGNIRSPKEIENTQLTDEYHIPRDYPTREACLLNLGFKMTNQVLGKGSFAVVFKVVDLKKGEEMACKEIRLRQEQFNSLKNELFVMCKLEGHENLVRIVKHFIMKLDNDVNDRCYIIMELANDNALNMLAAVTMTEAKAKDWFRQIAYGLLYLHTKVIAHKDLKLENILVFEQNNRETLKLSDFGLSRISFDPIRKKVIKGRTFTGTVDYMSPQVLRLFLASERNIIVDTLREYDPFKADCWALGVCLYRMINGSIPFKSIHHEIADEEVYRRMKKKQIEFSPNVVHQYSDECLLLIKQLLEPDPSVRLPMDVVIRHKWLNT